MSGKLPDGWRFDTLANLTAQVKRGAAPSYSTEPTGIFAISQKCVRNGSIDLSVARPHNPAKAVPAKAYLQLGDVCVNSTGTGTLGRVALWEHNDNRFFADTHVTIVRPDSDKVEPFMLAAYLGAPSTTETIYRDCVTGSTNQIELSAAAFGQLVVPVPSLNEQRRIAEVLRSVDAAIALNEATVASCRTLIGKLARDLAERCEGTINLAGLGKVVTGRTPSPKQAELWDGDLPFVTPGDLVAGNVSVAGAARTLVEDSRHGATILPANAVLVTCIGSTVGKTAITRKRCVTNQQINAICCPAQIAGFVYLACVAAYETIVANAGKQAVPIINKSTFSSIEVPAMSMAEMTTISEMVDAIDSEISAAQLMLDTLHQTKATLTSDLLSGRVRVPA